MTSIMDDFELIYSYTREEAVEDGVLYNLSLEFPEEVKEAGINIPIFCTEFVYNTYIMLTEKAEKALNDPKGKAWDILFMSRPALKKSLKDGYAYFDFYCVVDRLKPSFCRCVVEFDGEAFTIMKIGED